MKIGIVNEETWGFLHEIAANLKVHHQTTIFKRRVSPLPFFNERSNRFLLHRDLSRFMRQNDVVFFEWASELLATATRLPKQCGIVTRLHRYEMYKWVDHINWDTVDAIILVSQAKKREFVAKFPTQAAKVVVINEAVDLENFKPDPTPKPFKGNIGILCHIAPRKRVYELILAFYELARQRSDLHLHIGGDLKAVEDAYYFALEDIVARLGLKSRVTFHGPITDPASWYRDHIDILISNSYSEGLQVAPIEAMACGCYCLVHHWAGADELLPAGHLFFTDSELQEKILAYCYLSPEEKSRLQREMRSIVQKNFDIKHTKVSVREVIEACSNENDSLIQAKPAAVVTTSE